MDQGIHEAEALGALSVQAELEAHKGFLLQDEPVMLQALAHARDSGNGVTLAIGH